MAIISANQAKPQYDVVIVGSGAAGGQSAYTLTLNGAQVRDARSGPKLRRDQRDADVQHERSSAADGERDRR